MLVYKAPALGPGLAHLLWPKSFLVKQSLGLLVGTKGELLSEPLRTMLHVQFPGQFWEGCHSCPLQTCIAVFLLPPVIQTRSLLPFLLG